MPGNHQNLLMFLTALICSTGMGMPVSGFPNQTAYATFFLSLCVSSIYSFISVFLVQCNTGRRHGSAIPLECRFLEEWCTGQYHRHLGSSLSFIWHFPCFIFFFLVSHCSQCLFILGRSNSRIPPDASHRVRSSDVFPSLITLTYDSYFPFPDSESLSLTTFYSHFHSSERGSTTMFVYFQRHYLQSLGTTLPGVFLSSYISPVDSFLQT